MHNGGQSLPEICNFVFVNVLFHISKIFEIFSQLKIYQCPKQTRVCRGGGSNSNLAAEIVNSKIKSVHKNMTKDKEGT